MLIEAYKLCGKRKWIETRRKQIQILFRKKLSSYSLYFLSSV